MQSRKLVIAAGGTGGHMFPAQALAEEMLNRGWRVSLSTDARGARYAGAFPDAVTREVVRAATPARGGAVGKLTAPVLIARGVWDTFLAMRKDRPAVVAGFGGYPAVPAMSAAKMLGIPTLIHEQNGVPGRVNRLFAPRVNMVACSVEPTVLPAGATSEHTGNPVRRSVVEVAGAPYTLRGDGPVNVLVIGGSQGAAILSRVVPASLAALPDELRARLSVSHQARGEDEARVRDAYAAARITADVRPFFDDVPQRLVDCHLVVSRAGASSVADIAVVGRPSILIPYALATDDHQAANARGLVDAGAALLVRDADFTPRYVLEKMVPLLGDDTALAKMARSAKGLGDRDASGNFVRMMLEALGG